MIDLDDGRCRWPKGCFQPVCLVEGSEHGLCYFHEKLLVGLISPREQTVNRSGISPADILSDEQRELVLGLHALGANPADVRRALSKRFSRTGA